MKEYIGCQRHEDEWNQQRAPMHFPLAATWDNFCHENPLVQLLSWLGALVKLCFHWHEEYLLSATRRRVELNKGANVFQFSCNLWQFSWKLVLVQLLSWFVLVKLCFHSWSKHTLARRENTLANKGRQCISLSCNLGQLQSESSFIHSLTKCEVHWFLGNTKDEVKWNSAQ